MTDNVAPESEPGSDLAAALSETAAPAPHGSRAHALTDTEASALAAECRATVIVLAGTVKSGKTTLITSLYERFGHGPIAGRQFAGSLTLPGFEARAQGLRPQQGGLAAMPHTHRNAVPWLHLRVRPRDKTAQELLVGDFDGELFDSVVEGKEEPTNVPAIHRADHLSIVLDGYALVDLKERPLARQRTLDLIDVLTRPSIAVDPSAFSLVLTKLDLVNQAPREERAAARAVVTEARKRLAERTARAAPPVVETAAISLTADLPLGHGIDDLLDLWDLQPATRRAAKILPPAQFSPNEWFGRFRA